MNPWYRVYDDVTSAMETSVPGTLWFRGHSDSRWELLPSLARCRPVEEVSRPYRTDHDREQGIFHRFMTGAGNLLPAGDPWSIVFAMQHHGIPTRLLDWSTTFGIALYFAMKNCEREACIWILNPHDLNEYLIGMAGVLDVGDIGPDYREMFITQTQTPRGAALAFDPPRNHPRVFNQRSGFTLHADMTRALDQLAPGSLRRIDIPEEAHPGAREFLDLAGISEFSLFPDLDGLARELRAGYF